MNCNWINLDTGQVQCKNCGTIRPTPRYRQCIYSSYKPKIQEPSKTKQAWAYANAIARWKLAGSPTRTETEIAEILAICRSCEYFTEDKRPRCKLCGCSINNLPNGVSNKIAMATESCPDNPPRWTTKRMIPQLTWSYGITTVPSRLNTLLPQTMQSLARAGFDNPIVFFDGDPNTITPKNSVINRVGTGHLVNWMTALFHLYTVSPTADRFAIFEDDCLAVSNLREYLNATTNQENGFWNLITHNDNLLRTGPNPGWHPSNQKGRGAVGLVFTGDAVAKIISSPIFLNKPKEHKLRCPDGMLAQITKSLGITEYVHYPSLLQHTGANRSTLGHKKYQIIKCFQGESYDPLNLL